MRKLPPQNLFNLLISVMCATALAIVITKSGPNPLIAMLSAFVTVLCVQLAFVRRELSKLKDEISPHEKN